MTRQLSIAGVVLAGCILIGERPIGAYSVLTHEGAVDALWDGEIAPFLRQRFTGLTDEALVEARSYAYGGSLIQDLGYYPFGSRTFTNLTHYVRTGDFVEALIRGATNANEYAFALGALAHYTSDNAAHPLAVNRAVPIVYPKVRAKVGNEALYIDSPSRHLMVEFAFDVLQVARGAYVAQAFRNRIGFHVAEPLLERAVLETYGVALDDMMNVDLAIGTYRYAVSTTIPELTRLAWRDKRKEIEQATPGVTEQSFVIAFSRQQYEQEFGNKYQKPGVLSRVLAFILKIVPKIGPFKTLAFEPLTEDAERLLVESVAAARTRYRTALRALRADRLDLPNTDFDTGRPPALGDNRLADDTHVDLLRALAKKKTKAPAALREQLASFFTAMPHGHFKRKEETRIRGDLAQLGQR